MSRIVFLILLILPFALQAQITAPTANATRRTSYPVTGRTDSIFIFCGSSSSTGALTAVSPDGGGPYTFTWTRYDQSTGTWATTVKTETALSSTAAGLTEGGYRVHINDASDTYLYAWVHIDNPVSVAALKNYTCTYVALDGTASKDDFYYRDLTNNASVLLPNAVDFTWSSSPESTIKPNEIDPIISKPPLTDITYILEVADSFGCKTTSSFFYESIHVEAAFTASPVEGEAPLEVTFTNNSVRAANCTWDFGDDSVSYLIDPPAHKYYIPGTYTVKLSIESDLFCTDEYSLDIKVVDSKLDMPNVFTPNGDGFNDFFVPDFASLKFVTIQIFSKSGQRVYHFEAEGEAVSEWKGWDGKINNSDRYAEPGVYYYVIRGKGWDDKEYKGSFFRGVVYLYR